MKSTDIEMQNECRQLVDTHVYACLTELIGFFSANSHAIDGTDYYSYEDDLFPLLSKDEYLEVAKENGFGGNSEDEAMEFCDKNNIEARTLDALEHWLVSDWLAYNLKYHSEMVGSILGLTVWGRQTSGQAIYIGYSNRENLH